VFAVSSCSCSLSLYPFHQILVGRRRVYNIRNINVLPRVKSRADHIVVGAGVHVSLLYRSFTLSLSHTLTLTLSLSPSTTTAATENINRDPDISNRPPRHINHKLTLYWFCERLQKGHYSNTRARVCVCALAYNTYNIRTIVMCI